MRQPYRIFIALEIYAYAKIGKNNILFCGISIERWCKFDIGFWRNYKPLLTFGIYCICRHI